MPWHRSLLIYCGTAAKAKSWNAVLILHICDFDGLHNVFGEGSDLESSAYISDMAFAKYCFACGLFIWE